ncbi:hypothetical protein [Spiroplasma cantharicola]|uniref:Uncharacterized protein n=1 Tax=Spiroplasma cantharicola TaxID=362837 RepID=A0A0M4JJ62_9MOLU|nr:hypothetical protein [Spiroplasma cantharicola]ALD66779.1 hypothetical protein SCANT_v1c08730 [Spiroplasma cantharicola]
MDKKNDDFILNKKTYETNETKKRLEEIKNSNILMSSQSTANDFYVPKRKTKNSQLEKVDIIKPRKKKNLPFSPEQQKEIEETITNIQSEYREFDKSSKIFEKRLLKEEQKLSRLILKTNRKIGSLIFKEDTEQLEKTVELQEEYLKAFDKVHDNIDTIALREQNVSLRDRRKHIYSKAYNAETERARRLIELRNKNRATWTNQIKKEVKANSIRKSENWMERLGILDDE